jgi:hypothetical protein
MEYSPHESTLNQNDFVGYHAVQSRSTELGKCRVIIERIRLSYDNLDILRSPHRKHHDSSLMLRTVKADSAPEQTIYEAVAETKTLVRSREYFVRTMDINLA